MINQLHASHLKANSIDPALLPLNMAFERAWFEAMNNGVTPEMIEAVIAYRLQRIKIGVRNPECTRLRNLVGNDEKIAELLEDWAFLQSRKRMKIMDPARASVLRATGRSDQLPDRPAKPAAEVLAKLAEEFRKAAG